MAKRGRQSGEFRQFRRGEESSPRVAKERTPAREKTSGRIFRIFRRGGGRCWNGARYGPARYVDRKVDYKIRLSFANEALLARRSRRRDDTTISSATERGKQRAAEKSIAVRPTRVLRESTVARRRSEVAFARNTPRFSLRERDARVPARGRSTRLLRVRRRSLLTSAPRGLATAVRRTKGETARRLFVPTFQECLARAGEITFLGCRRRRFSGSRALLSCAVISECASSSTTEYDFSRCTLRYVSVGTDGERRQRRGDRRENIAGQFSRTP